MTRARVTITVPPELLEAADRRAEALDRSRSWLFVEAVRAYLAGDARRSGASRGAGDWRRGAAAAPKAPGAYLPGLGRSRQAQLEADLALSPEARVRQAEETTRMAELRGAVAVRDRVIVFGRHEEFLAWERREALGGG